MLSTALSSVRGEPPSDRNSPLEGFAPIFPDLALRVSAMASGSECGCGVVGTMFLTRATGRPLPAGRRPQLGLETELGR